MFVRNRNITKGHPPLLSYLVHGSFDKLCMTPVFHELSIMLLLDCGKRPLLTKNLFLLRISVRQPPSEVLGIYLCRRLLTYYTARINAANRN